MTQLVVNIQKQTDLEKLLAFLKGMKIPFVQTESEAPTAENAANTEGYLSLETIKQRYPNEWVLVASAQNNDNKILGGIVIVHHTDKRQMALQAREILKNYTQTASFYTGEYPKIAKIGILRKISHSEK